MPFGMVQSYGPFFGDGCDLVIGRMRIREIILMRKLGRLMLMGSICMGIWNRMGGLLGGRRLGLGIIRFGNWGWGELLMRRSNKAWYFVAN